MACLRLFGSALLVMGGGATPLVAQAHSRLTAPPSRSEDDFLMEAPCGGLAAGSERATFEAGSSTVLAWALTQNHNASFRIAFSPGGDAGFDDWVLGSRPDVPRQFEYEQEIPLPECVCDDCAIQLLQFTSPTMLEAYYSCADIQLTQPPGEDLPRCDQGGETSAGGSSGGSTSTTAPGTSTAGGSGEDSATTTGVTSGGPPATEGPAGSVTGDDRTGTDAAESTASRSDGGCRIGEGGVTGWWWLPVLAVVGRWRWR